MLWMSDSFYYQKITSQCTQSCKQSWIMKSIMALQTLSQIKVNICGRVRTSGGSNKNIWGKIMCVLGRQELFINT